MPNYSPIAILNFFVYKNLINLSIQMNCRSVEFYWMSSHGSIKEKKIGKNDYK